MKRMHMSFNVKNLEKSVAFYSHLFQQAPNVLKTDYAKWMMEDPRVNFVLEASGDNSGFGHVGIQVEDPDELNDMFERMKTVEAPYLSEGETDCCYHKSEKSWTADPDGIMWEAFHTLDQIEQRGESNLNQSQIRSSCCQTS